jgi:hypothetical protein
MIEPFGVIFLCVTGIWAFAMGLMLAAFHYDKIIVWLLDWTDLPLFPHARLIAASIYRHPEQWESTDYGLAHKELGRMSSSGLASPFGKWEPNKIEKRIIENAIVWQQRKHIETALIKRIN